MSASGLRALRYAHEVDGIDKVVALDNDKGSLVLCFSFNNHATQIEMELVFSILYLFSCFLIAPGILFLWERVQ